MPSQQAVDEASDSANLALERVPEEKVMPALVPVVRDMAGNVPIYPGEWRIRCESSNGVILRQSSWKRYCYSYSRRNGSEREDFASISAVIQRRCGNGTSLSC